MNNPYLRVGRIVRAHGVRGAVKVLPETDDPSRFLALKEAYIEENGGFRPILVSQAQLLSDGAVLYLEGVDTPEQAELMRGKYIAVDRAHAVQLPKDTYFIADLIGCEAFDTDGRRLGKVTDVFPTGANDVYELDGGRVLIPALKRVLSKVDTEHQKIVFHSGVLSEVAVFAD